MNVLSLFDGISCGFQALKQAGIKVDNYYASEIDKYAIQIAKKNHPKIIQLGDVTKWREWDLPSIDLIIGGSPCQGFSFAGKQLAFDDPRSALFFEFVNIKNHFNPSHFMLENVRMKKEHQNAISDLLGVKPIKIDSGLLSAQRRNRLYWCNWDVAQPEDKKLILDDILQEDVGEKYFQKQGWIDWFKKNAEFQLKKGYCAINPEKAITMTARQYASWNGNFILLTNRGNNPGGPRALDGKIPTITANSWQHNNHLVTKNSIRRLTPVEIERAFTYPDNYTDGVSDSQRYKMLGNGWTVSVIVHILKSMLNT